MAPRSLTLSPNFSSTPSPYTTAPSSPKLLGYSDDDDDYSPESEFELFDSVCSFVPFNWEEKPGKPKTLTDTSDYDNIAFEFRVNELNNLSLPAEDLFDGGKIKPLKPPPGLQLESAGIADSPSPISGRKSISHSSRRMIIALSSRWNYNFIDPFEAAIESARKGDDVCEIEPDETTSFTGSSRFKKLTGLLTFKRGNYDSKASAGFGSTGSSGSGSSSASGSVGEPDNRSDDEGRRRLTLCRPHLFRCFMESV